MQKGGQYRRERRYTKEAIIEGKDDAEGRTI